jgi:hypothetical protein
MARSVKLNELDGVLEDLTYPIAREDVVEQCSDVRIELADGSENLAELIAGSTDDAFGSADSLGNEIRSLLPQHAVGEPYQSEGEG